jgi:cutinase
MSTRKTAPILGVAVVMALAPLSAPIDIPSASADPCPDVEVVFARGTGEPPGVGGAGQAFVDSLSSQVAGRSIAVYPVNYPAANDYRDSALAGADDASAHVQDDLAHCPNTRTVLGGYSQGAAVIDLSTGKMPPQVADHVVAVALFGNPSSPYASQLWGGQLPAISPLYRPKTIDLCLPDDIICSETGNIVPHLMYVPGMTDQAATFAASRV